MKILLNMKKFKSCATSVESAVNLGDFNMYFKLLCLLGRERSLMCPMYNSANCVKTQITLCAIKLSHLDF